MKSSNTLPRLGRLTAAGVFAVLLFIGIWGFGSSKVTAQQPSSPPSGTLQTLENAFTGIAEKVEPSVVMITAERTRKDTRSSIPDIFRGWPFGDIPQGRIRPEPQKVGGSGFIVRPDGYILTNDHVVGGADKVTVTLKDGTEYTGKVFRDYLTDLAVIKVDAKNLPAVQIADSGRLKSGSWAIAIGSPFGLANTLTVGVVSAIGREDSIPDGEGGARYYWGLIQTDASINPGNSGGPLLNLRGEVIGVNVAIESPTGANAGIGYAIPSNTAKFVLDQLISKGKVVRGFLGITPRDVKAAEAKSYGVNKGAFVAAVQDGTPAAKAGLMVEDVIVEVNGKPVEGAVALREAIASTSPGSKIPIVIMRGKQRKTISVTLEAAPDRTPSSRDESSAAGDLGLTTATLSKALRDQYNIPADIKGVVVTDVQAGGPAYRAGLREGDVIQKVNGQSVASLDAYRKALGSPKSGTATRLVVRRGDSSLFVEIPAP